MTLFEIDRELMTRVSGGGKCEADFDALIKARGEDQVAALKAWKLDPDSQKLEDAEGKVSARATSAWRALHDCLHPKPQ